jgi:hypothetical protein
MMKGRPAWAVFVVIGLGPVLIFGPMLLRGDVLFWGTPMLQFIPWHEYALQLIRDGYLPFWNPLSGFGAPLFANYQSALIYPPNVLLWIFGPAYGHGVLVTLHLIWAGIGTALLARQMGLSLRGQMVAASAFSLSGYLVARGSFISINHAAAWLPWIILGCERLVRSEATWSDHKWWSDLGLLGIFFACQWLAGHAQTSWYTLLFAVGWVAWQSLRRGSWSQLSRNGPQLLFAGLLGLILASVQLVPTIEYLLQSHRSTGLDREFALTYSFWPWRIAGLIAPDLFGNPASGTFWGYGNYWEDAIYIGVFPLLMALVAFFRLFRNDEREHAMPMFLLVSSFIALLFALGKNTPVFLFLFEHIPTFDLFQAPTRWNLIFVFSVSLLAGFGVDLWNTPEGRGLYWTRLGTAGAGIIAIASYLGARLLGDVEATFVPAFARAGLLLFTVGLLTLFLNKQRRMLVLTSVGAFLLVDLVSAGYGLNPAIDRSVFQGRSQLAAIVQSSERVYMPSDLEEQIKFERTYRFDTFDPGIDWRLVRDVGLPNTTLLDAIPSADNFDPFTPARYNAWMNWLDTLELKHRDSVLNFVGVGWRAQSDESVEFGVRYENLGPTSRAQMIPEALSFERGEEALKVLAQASFDPYAQVLLETESDSLPSGSTGEAFLLPQMNNQRVEVKTVSEQGSWLLLMDTWYPGWKVFIDGESADLYKADYLFMSVWVPAGQHQVEFRYQPTFFVSAAILSAVGWLAVITFGIRWRKR